MLLVPPAQMMGKEKPVWRLAFFSRLEERKGIKLFVDAVGSLNVTSDRFEVSECSWKERCAAVRRLSAVPCVVSMQAAKTRERLQAAQAHNVHLLFTVSDHTRQTLLTRLCRSCAWRACPSACGGGALAP